MEKKFLLVLYLSIIAVGIVQAFTHPFVDQSVELLDNYFIFQGMTPYVDFFEHHPLLQNFLLSPVFWLTGPSGFALLAYRILAFIGVLFSAWLVYMIAKRNFANPHAASLFFLAGYTGLVIGFLRYEFWSLLFLLLFLYFQKPFWRGLALAGLGATSPIVVLATIALGLAYVASLRKFKPAAFAIGGGLLGLVIWRIVHWNIPVAAMYEAIVIWNNKLGAAYALPFLEVFFFSLIYVGISLIAAAPGAIAGLRKWKPDAVLASVFVATFITQVILMNVVYGMFTRVKLPAFLPVLGVLAIFVAGLKWRTTGIAIGAAAVVTFLAFTPSLAMPELGTIDASVTLNRCVAPDAKFVLEQDTREGRMHAPLFREPLRYYWFILTDLEDDINGSITRLATAVDRKFEAKQPAMPISICGNSIARDDWMCSEEKLAALQGQCRTYVPAKSIWYRTRTAIKDFLV